MAWRGEVEDGLGWGGLVASKSEQREEARLAALERDAARYRWLREHVTDTHANYRDVNGHLQGFDFDCEGDVELDAAIDAAMKGANNQVQPASSE